MEKYLILLEGNRASEMEHGTRNSVYNLKNYTNYYSHIGMDFSKCGTINEIEKIMFSQFTKVLLIETNLDKITGYYSSDKEHNKYNCIESYDCCSFNDLINIININENTKFIVNNSILHMLKDQEYYLTNNLCEYEINRNYIDLSTKEPTIVLKCIINDGGLIKITEALKYSLDKEVYMSDKFKILEILDVCIDKVKDAKFIKNVLKLENLKDYNFNYASYESYTNGLIRYDLIDYLINKATSIKTKKYKQNLSHYISSEFDRLKKAINDDDKFDLFIFNIVKFLYSDTKDDNRLSNVGHILMEDLKYLGDLEIDNEALIYKLREYKNTDKYNKLIESLDIKQIPDYVNLYLSNMRYKEQVGCSFTFIQLGKEDDVLPVLNLFAENFLTLISSSKGTVFEYILNNIHETERISIFMDSIFKVMEETRNPKQIVALLNYIKRSMLSQFITTDKISDYPKISRIYLDEIL